MNRHITLVHEEKKPFKCSVCEYKYSESSNINRQIASVHERKKPFNCKICKPSFSEKGNMVLHISAIHEGKKSIVTCVLLRTKQNLKTHFFPRCMREKIN